MATAPSTMDVEHLRGRCGVEVSGVDLAAGLDEATARSLSQTLWEHHVVVLREQHLEPDQLATFAETFGQLAAYPFVEPLADHPMVIPIIKNPEDSKNFGGVWHTDMVWTPAPAGVTVLQGIDVPERGGDTLFADCCAAYDALSPAMAELLSGLSAVYEADLVPRGSYASGMSARADTKVMADRFVHPIIRTHPHTGAKILYCSPPHTKRFDGMTVEESRPLLEFITSHQLRPEFTTRVSWEPGSITIWDNRAVLHYAVNDYAGQRRHMHRVTVAGEIPV